MPGLLLSRTSVAASGGTGQASGGMAECDDEPGGACLDPVAGASAVRRVAMGIRSDSQPHMRARSADLWVFGYGSLMWRPGFPYLDRRLGHLFGYHRSLCVLSHVHRGTPDTPGLV